MNYSVLMSVYKKEKTQYFKTALNSMLEQTVKSNDIVIIEDGELTNDLEETINEYEKMYPEIIHVIRRKQNKGLGYSLKEGVIACQNEIIARMDTDDYSVPDRCEKQIKYLINGYDLVGSNIDEFEEDINELITTKKMPEKKADILKYAKFRNPFNHPTVMFKKKAVIEAGNYSSLFRLEDYDLWVKMLSNDIKCINVQESLVKMRVNRDFYKRRGGKENLKSHLTLKKTLLINKQINILEYMIGCLIMIGRAYCPGGIKQFLYKSTLRK